MGPLYRLPIDCRLIVYCLLPIQVIFENISDHIFTIYYFCYSMENVITQTILSLQKLCSLRFGGSLTEQSAELGDADMRVSKYVFSKIQLYQRDPN